MTGNVLILGASGRFGRAADQAFTEAGWKVRRFDRKRDDLDRALQGMDVAVMASNPPGYQYWEKELVPLHRRVAEAAARAGVTVILPGNVYVFGPKAPSPWRPDTPHLAENPLARLRMAVEAGYREAGARTIILRCGDFVDGVPSGNWFENFITKTLPRGFIRYPGDPDTPHAWAWLPDAGRAAVALAERRESFGNFEDVPFEGFTLTGRELAALIGRVTGREVGLKPFPWWQFRLLRPFMPLLDGVFEMRYLWSLPQRLDGTRLRELAPEFDPVPAEKAFADILRRLGQSSATSTQTSR